MSCFQHSPEFFARLLNALCEGPVRGYSLYAVCLNHQASDEELRAALWHLLDVASSAQDYAYAVRYKEARSGSVLCRGLPSPAPSNWKAVDVCKALTSVLYQCDEEDTCERPDFANSLKTLERLRDKLAMLALRTQCPAWDESDAWEG